MLKQKGNIIFILALVVMAFFYNYHGIINTPANSLHTWRQSDCLSITTNFFHEKLSFFTPKIHWTSPSGDNHALSEFPIIYYTVGNLWKIFGQHYFIYRLINILFVFSGLFSLYKLSKLIIKDNFWSIFSSLFLFSSPLLVYYTNNFLADAPALGMSLTGIYFLYKFLKSNNRFDIFAAILFLSLAGLLKISSLILFVAFLGLYSLNMIVNLVSRKKIVSLQIKLVALFMVPLILVAWYSYARYFSSKHNSGIFLQSIYPIWDLDTETRSFVTERLYWKLLPTFFNKQVLGVILLLFPINIIFGIKKHTKLILVYLVSFIGIVAYLLLWYKAFDVHDYYLTNLLFFIPFTLIISLKLFSELFPSVFKSTITKAIAGLLLLFLVYQATMLNRVKYNRHNPWLDANRFIEQQDLDFWDYKQTNYSKKKKAFETITPYLRELGIKRDDMVISLSDNTINHTLYLMDQKGFTDYGYVPYKGKEKTKDRIEYFKQIGAQYLIIHDKSDLQYIPEHIIKNRIGSYHNISIYKL